MNREDAEEYTESLGQIVTGSWRQIAWAVRQQIPQALGLTTKEWVTDRLGGYVRLSVPERQEAVAELAEDGMSQKEIAEVVGVTPMTISRDVTNVSSEQSSSQDAAPESVTNVIPEPSQLEVMETLNALTQPVPMDEVHRSLVKMQTGLNEVKSSLHLIHDPAEIAVIRNRLDEATVLIMEMMEYVGT